jgi:predicted nuclease of predicted toxin-antitoxin system
VKLKLDENLGTRCVEMFAADGHDVTTVGAQSMTSAADQELIEACRLEDRALVTLDLDFSNPLVFPPQQYAGIAVLRLPSQPSHLILVALIQTLIDALKREELKGRLWSVEPNRIRIYQTPSDAM